MMRTAIAVDSANGRRGSGPTSIQTAKVAAATSSTAGTNQPVTRSATRWIGALRPLRALDERDDLRQRRVSPDALGAHDERARSVHGGADDAVARGLLDRQRLAGEHRLVDRRGAIDEHAVDRHAVARPHPDQVADDHLAERDLTLAPVAQHAGGRRPQPQQGLHRAGGLPLGAGLEPSPEQDETDDHRSRVEVRLVAQPRCHDRVGHERDRDRIGVRRHRADRDERVHVGLAMARGPQRRGRGTGVRRRTGRSWRGSRNQRLMSIIGHGAPPGQNMTAIIVPPIAERGEGLDEQRSLLGRMGGVDRVGDLLRRRGLGGDVVAGGLDGLHDPAAIDQRRVEAHGGTLGSEIDRRFGDAVGAVEEPLDAVHAAGAGHAQDGQRELIGRGRSARRGSRHRCFKDTTGEYRPAPCSPIGLRRSCLDVRCCM